MAAEHFEDRVVRLLSGHGDLTSRPLFSGHGLYWRETIFSILFGGKLFLKVDEAPKADFLARGLGPCRRNERQTLKSYYRGAAGGPRRSGGAALLGRGGDPD